MWDGKVLDASFLCAIDHALLLNGNAWKHESRDDDVGCQQGIEQWLQEVISLLVLFLANHVEAAQDAHLSKADSKQDSRENCPTKCKGIIEALLASYDGHVVSRFK